MAAADAPYKDPAYEFDCPKFYDFTRMSLGEVECDKWFASAPEDPSSGRHAGEQEKEPLRLWTCH
jgi:hypothetical protein